MRDSLRQVGPRLRADLEWSHHQDQSKWIARDPLALQFFSFSELEWSATKLMTGRLSVSNIVAQLQRAHPTVGIDANWLRSLLSRLQMHHLLLPQSRLDVTRVGHVHLRSQTPAWLNQALSPLAIRVPLCNPTRFLKFLSPVATFLFHPLLLIGWLVAGCALAICVLREVLVSGLVGSIDWRMLRGDGWWLLLASYLIAKSVHELGHGLACIKYRTECRELGIMFLCLAPCLYCDTSDSWKLSSKWQRATIAAAGMIVEWILATIAAAVWLLTQDGAVHSMAASIMVVCSVGTLLVNGNPFLKYDGYYLLSDLWGVPNLAEQGTDALRALITSGLSGRSLKEWSFDAPIGLLAGYAIIALFYRTFILGAILWFSWSALVPRGFGLLAVFLTASLLLGLVIGYSRFVLRVWREILNSQAIRVGRWTAFFAVSFLLIAFVLTVPLPDVIRARGVADYRDKQPLFASQTAELIYAAPANQVAIKGDMLLEFSSPEGAYELSELKGDIAIVEETLKQLRLSKTLDQTSAYLVPVKTEELQQMRARERVLVRELESLQCRAPHDGYLLAGPHVVPKAPTAPRDDRVRQDPLEPNAVGSTCDRSALVGWFTRKEHLILNVIVSEHDVKKLVEGMPATIGWDATISKLGRGTIARIAAEPIDETPASLIGDATLLSERNANGTYLPSKPHYEVTIDVRQSEEMLTPLRGSLATVQFSLPSQTLWQHLIEAVRSNIKPL